MIRILSLCCLLAACTPSRTKPSPIIYTHTVGDIVWLKPDSVKGVVVGRTPWEEAYDVKYQADGTLVVDHYVRIYELY